LNNAETIFSEVIDEVRKGRIEEASKLIYKSQARRDIISYLIGKGHNKDSALQVFHDGMLIFFNNVQNSKLLNNNNLSGYLFTICRNISKEYKDIEIGIDKEFRDFMADYETDYIKPEDEAEIRNSAKKALRAYTNLSEICRSLMCLKYVKGISHEVIAKKMNYSNAVVARNRLHYCLETLLRNMDNSPSSFTNIELENLIDDLNQNEN
jgi:DNA-directed RNA polymerase specialized sigma24 family protein